MYPARNNDTPPADTNTTRHILYLVQHPATATASPTCTAPLLHSLPVTISSHLICPTPPPPPQPQQHTRPTLDVSMPGHDATAHTHTHRRCPLPCLREGYPRRIVGNALHLWAWTCGFPCLTMGTGVNAGFLLGWWSCVCWKKYVCTCVGTWWMRWGWESWAGRCGVLGGVSSVVGVDVVYAMSSWQVHMYVFNSTYFHPPVYTHLLSSLLFPSLPSPSHNPRTTLHNASTAPHRTARGHRTAPEATRRATSIQPHACVSPDSLVCGAHAAVCVREHRWGWFSRWPVRQGGGKLSIGRWW